MTQAPEDLAKARQARRRLATTALLARARQPATSPDTGKFRARASLPNITGRRASARQAAAVPVAEAVPVAAVAEVPSPAAADLAEAPVNASRSIRESIKAIFRRSPTPTLE